MRGRGGTRVVVWRTVTTGSIRAECGSSRDSITIGGSTGGGDTTEGDGSAGTTDPIENARVVLGGGDSSAQIKAPTDAELLVTGTAISNQNYLPAWSSVHKVVGGLEGVALMDVMYRILEVGPSSNIDTPETTALCAAAIDHKKWAESRRRPG